MKRKVLVFKGGKRQNSTETPGSTLHWHLLLFQTCPIPAQHLATMVWFFLYFQDWTVEELRLLRETVCAYFFNPTQRVKASSLMCGMRSLGAYICQHTFVRLYLRPVWEWYWNACRGLEMREYWTDRVCRFPRPRTRNFHDCGAW